MTDSFSKEATWDNYAKHMIHTKSAKAGSFGWIIGSDGTVYGSSPDAPALAPDEAKGAGDARPGMGCTIAGTKYQMVRPMDDAIIGKKGKGGIIVFKGKKLNLVGIIVEADGDAMTAPNLFGPMEKIFKEFAKAGW